ncbi:hypothetical protein LP7551_00292 [Roseibium album]|nr:hypothetical protein LP7551_00292 [Roseibium album]
MNRLSLTITMLATSILLCLPANADTGTQQSGFSKVASDIRLNWSPTTETVVITIATGCRSAHTGTEISNDLLVKYDQANRRFQITGNFHAKPAKGQLRIGPADCMGSQSRSFEFKNVPNGHYEFFRENSKLWDLKLDDQKFEVLESRFSTRIRMD